jgi:plastocyanin
MKATKRNLILGGVSLGLLIHGAIWLCIIPSAAVAAPFGIAIDSGSPYFMPKAATIAPHAPIRWENTTGSHHTITHEGCERDGVCVFDSGMLAPDGSYELPGLPPGTYPYVCRLHPIMRGILIVQESGASSNDSVRQ